MTESSKPFIGNGDVSIWLIDSRVGRKNPIKQTNKQTKELNIFFFEDKNKLCLLNIIMISSMLFRENLTCIYYASMFALM